MRARARRSLALGSALACAIVTSALLLSGSVRVLRGAFSAGADRTDTPLVAEAALQKAPIAQCERGGDVRRCQAATRSDAALASRAARAPEIVSYATRLCSIVSRSHGADIARGYDATAPPGARA